MKTEVLIGGKSVELLCNGATPILYRYAFGEDFLAFMMRKAKIQASDPRRPNEELQNMTLEERQAYIAELSEYGELAMNLLSEMETAVGQLAYIMAYQAEAGISAAVTGVSQQNYLTWLAQFMPGDINAAMREILAAYNLSAKTLAQPKNASDRSTESTTQPSML